MTTQDTLAPPDEAQEPLEWTALNYPRWPVAVWVALLGGAGIAEMVSQSLAVALIAFAVLACLGAAAFAVARRERLTVRPRQDTNTGAL